MCSTAEGWRSPWTAAARYTAALSDAPDGNTRVYDISHTENDNKYGFPLPEEKLEFECFYSHIEKLCTGQPQQPILKKRMHRYIQYLFLFLVNVPDFA